MDFFLDSNPLFVTNINPGDYKSTDGLWMCGGCNTPKQTCKLILDQEMALPIMCKCQAERAALEQEHHARIDFENRLQRLRLDGMADMAYLRYTFANDDSGDGKKAAVCRRYVAQWEEMRANNYGILFFGGVGTGKTFYAGCIANALIEKCVSVCMTSFPRILNRMQGRPEDRQEAIDGLGRYNLLVLDDLGAERDTSYSAEIVFSVVDARVRAQKPLIVTTNLSMEEIKNPPTMGYRRIYDRILEMCPIQIKFDGPSRRAGNQKDRAAEARRLLGL